VLVQGDVAQDADCRRIAAAAEPFGRIDALFNNAGVTTFAPDHADMDAVDAEDFLRLYAVNVVGAFQMVRAARSLLEAAPRPGAVVNTASIAGVTGIGSSVPYAASKGALTTMTLSLARALAPKIRVNAVCPGFIDTPWFGKGLGEAGADRLRANAAANHAAEGRLHRRGHRRAAVFLASPASRHITGETLLVDAGRTWAVRVWRCAKAAGKAETIVPSTLWRPTPLLKQNRHTPPKLYAGGMLSAGDLINKIAPRAWSTATAAVLNALAGVAGR
jgi:3-oxoacyl-[acyl-carrier protein] reductase